MDLFGYLFALEGYGYGHGRSHHWYGSNEKSKHAKGREEEATKKFDAMKMTMEVRSIAAVSITVSQAVEVVDQYVNAVYERLYIYFHCFQLTLTQLSH